MPSKGNTVGYVSNFRRLAVKKQFNESALLGIFCNSLSEVVKDSLAIRVAPTELWSFVSCCVELQNLTRDRAMHRK